jgi:hypothetical protein
MQLTIDNQIAQRPVARAELLEVMACLPAETTLEAAIDALTVELTARSDGDRVDRPMNPQEIAQIRDLLDESELAVREGRIVDHEEAKRRVRSWLP